MQFDFRPAAYNLKMQPCPTDSKEDSMKRNDLSQIATSARALHRSTRQAARFLSALCLLCLLAASGCQEDKAPVDPRVQSNPTDVPGAGNDSDPEKESISLFDGKSLSGWETIEFGGEEEIEVVAGEIQMGGGEALTGIGIDRDIEVPKINYEISLNAKRRDGNDFFCGLTFPVEDSHCTLVVGGWGGGVVGISNIDDRDASENETTVYKKFETEKWYPVRVRVTAEKITCWIGEEKLIDQSIVGRKISLRGGQMSLTTPIGICNFGTASSIKDIRIKKL